MFLLSWQTLGIRVTYYLLYDLYTGAGWEMVNSLWECFEMQCIAKRFEMHLDHQMREELSIKSSL